MLATLVVEGDAVTTAAPVFAAQEADPLWKETPDVVRTFSLEQLPTIDGIDPDTGKTQIVRYTAVHDVGVELNPALVEGQAVGGIAQQAGYEGDRIGHGAVVLRGPAAPRAARQVFPAEARHAPARLLLEIPDRGVTPPGVHGACLARSQLWPLSHSG